jgi:hypothetical protein
MSFAIFRTAKISTMGNLRASAEHNFRERVTLNADAKRTHLNSTSGAGSSAEVLASVKQKLEGLTVRKNAVLALEYFVGVSPDFKGDIEGYFDAAEKWLRDTHGAGFISFTRQYDETTPHACAYVVPLDPRGRLSASHFLDGRAKMSALQTDFWKKAGKPFGLSRGVEGSTATHQSVKSFYGKVQAPTPPSPKPPEKVATASGLEKALDFLGVDTARDKKVAEYESAKASFYTEVRARRKVEREKAKAFDLLAKEQGRRAKDLEALRARSTEARAIPLESVLEALEAQKDPKDKANWRTSAGRISIDGTRFFCHDLGKGGGGAIDLAMTLLDCPYPEAMAWLSKTFGRGEVLSNALATAKAELKDIVKATPAPDPLKAHQASFEAWPSVRAYLVEKRGLKASLVDEAHKAGLVHADRFKNACFTLGQGQGLALRGTGPSPFHGIRGEKAPFILKKKGDKKEVAFVESPIDALSLRSLGFEGEVVATMGQAGASLTSSLATFYRQEGWKVFSAFDADKAGEGMSKALGASERMRPKAKDWNADLLASHQKGQTLTPRQGFQTGLRS